MKKLLIAVVVFNISIIATAQKRTADFFTKSNDFFRTYVTSGKVNYQKLAKNNTDLKEIIKLSNTLKVNKEDVKLYQSYWINLYNLGVIDQIVENYPINSPMEISGFFDTNKRNLGGKEITLNDIENKLLRANFKDPRFHFVLVCGAVSCPPIVNYAYTPDLLESQLEKQTRLALNNPDFIKIANDKTEISEIFSWYQQDFGGTKEKVARFINQYRTEKIDSDFGYYTYNWQLNELKERYEIIEKATQKLSNVQTFTPSKLLAKNQFDVKWFNSLYTQTKQTLGGSSKSEDVPRENYFTSTLEFYYGITKNARINIGFITQARANTFNGKEAFSVFNFENDEVDSRSGITTFAPSIRIQPIATVPNFSFTSSVYFPIFKKNQNKYLDKNSVFWETKFFYDKTFGNNQWQIFTEADLGFNFGEKGGNENFANNSLGLPISAFLSYFPSQKSTVFVNAQQFFLISLGNDFEQNYTSLGIGGKYQITEKLNLEASYGKFVRGYNFQGLGQTFSLGIRYLSAN